MLSPPAFSFPTKVLLLAEMNLKIKSMKEREIVMITIQGLYNTAVCYTPELEEAARKQIQTVCDQAEFAGCKIRIMPDVHAGKGCTIGTTMTITRWMPLCLSPIVTRSCPVWLASISAAVWRLLSFVSGRSTLRSWTP